MQRLHPSKQKTSPSTAVLLTLVLGGTAAAQTPVGQASPVIGPGLFTIFERAFSAHGVAADKRVAFINEGFFEPQVHVIHRLTRASLGSLPEPAGGLSWPFFVRLRNTQPIGLLGSRGELVLLNSPPPEAFGTPAPSFIHVYEYEYTPLAGFSADLVSTHALPVNLTPPSLPPNGIIFPSSFDFLPSGEVVVIDLFSIWVGSPSLNDWRMGWTSFDFGIEPYCSTVIAPNGDEVPGFYLAVRDENWHKVRLPYQLAVPFPEPGLPAFKGITYIDLTDQIAILRVQTPGGIFTIDRALLLDETIPPFAKPYSILVAPEIGLSDLSGDVAYDHYHPDSEWVYWQRTPSESGQNQCAGAHPYSEKWSPIYRISVLTGEIELVAESWLLYDFPTVLSPIQPLGGSNDPFTYLVSSNVLETRVAGLNALAEQTNLIPPTIVPMVLVGAY
jgi:hypothetical protein